MKKRIEESLIATYNTLLWASVCTWVCVCVATFTTVSFFVSCSLFCLVHGAFFFEGAESNRAITIQRYRRVFRITTTSLYLVLSALSSDVLNANAENLTSVLLFQLFHCDLFDFLRHFVPEGICFVSFINAIYIRCCVPACAFLLNYTHE